METNMKARFPTFDFTNVRPHWARNPEFAQRVNAASLIPAYVEPYLVKVMRKARKQIDQKNLQLLEKLDIFVKQEMQHCKHHISFNNHLRACGYPEIAKLEAAIQADYDHFLENKSLRFNLAYCEGFESLSASGCEAWFERYGDLLAGADPEPSDLWRWHLAEEFEHRVVCSDIYHELSGLDPLSRYFYRLYGYFYAVVHLGRFVKTVTGVLLQKDRSRMSAEQLAASIQREKVAKTIMAKGVLSMMLKIASPFYDPAKRRPPRGYLEYLQNFEQRRAPPTVTNVALS